MGCVEVIMVGKPIVIEGLKLSAGEGAAVVCVVVIEDLAEDLILFAEVVV